MERIPSSDFFLRSNIHVTWVHIYIGDEYFLHVWKSFYLWFLSFKFIFILNSSLVLEIAIQNWQNSLLSAGWCWGVWSKVCCHWQFSWSTCGSELLCNWKSLWIWKHSNNRGNSSIKWLLLAPKIYMRIPYH